MPNGGSVDDWDGVSSADTTDVGRDGGGGGMAWKIKY